MTPILEVQDLTVRFPVAAGNLAEFYDAADGFIVGSHFKVAGKWTGAVDPKRVRKFMATHRQLGG